MGVGGGPVGKLALIGLDGATFRVLDPVSKAGVTPNLDALRARGTETTLRSTIPTYTPPAWVSMATGVNPGRHGIMGFLASTAQEPPQIAHSGLIGAPPMWRYLEALGVTTGVFNVPMTYPPSPVHGFMVAGGLASGWTDPEMPNFASDAGTARIVLDIAEGHYPLDTVVSYENDWRSPTIASQVEATQSLRRRVLSSLLEIKDPDVVFAVFEGPDRLQHLHYQYVVPFSDWYDHPEAAAARDRVFSFFAELDRTVGELAEWAGPGGNVLIVSDHGFGPWEKTFNVNLLLEKWGFLELPSLSRVTRLPVVAGGVQRVARRMLPSRVLHSAKARVGRRIVWRETQAFASHVAEQGIHVNEVGRLPLGIVEEKDVERIRAELTNRLLDLSDDDGQSVVDRVVTGQEAVHGPHARRAPDLFPFCRDQRYELSDTLAASSVFTDHRDRPWGYHHVDGIFVGAGPGMIATPSSTPLDIVDVLPTAFHLAGLPVPAGLDGKVATGILAGEAATRKVVTTNIDPEHHTSEENPFSPEEEKTIEESLRGLGYLE